MKKHYPFAPSLAGLFLGICGSPLALAAAGDFDTTFSGDGRDVGLAAGYQGEWRDIVPLADGRVVAVGTGYYHPELRFSVPVTGLATAYTAAGAVDTTWGASGNYVRSGAGGTPSSYNDAVAVAGGKLLLAGMLNSQQLLVTRLNANGTLDTAFGAGGHALVGSNVLRSPRIVARTDGSFIVAAPQVGTGTGKGTVQVFAFNADGSVDNGFDTDGLRVLDFSGAEFTEQTSVGLALQQDGKVLVGATEYGGGGDMVVYRLHADGSNDVSFDNMLINQDGRAVYSPGNSQEELMDIAVQPDGKVVIVGAYRPTVSDTFRGILVRAQANGRWDADFEGDGLVTLDVAGYHGEFFRRVNVLPDGDLLVMGNAVIGTAYPQESGVLLARFNAGGALDTGFANDGVQVTAEPVFGSCNQAFAAALAPEGKVLFAGESTNSVWTNTACNGTGSFMIARQLMPSQDTVPPTILSASPANGATGVKRGSDIVVTFDEPLDPDSVGLSSFALSCNETPVAGTVSYVDAPVPQLVFSPASALPTYRDCTATVANGGVSDVAGNALVGSYSWTFRTMRVNKTVTAQKRGLGAGVVVGHGTGVNSGSPSIDCGSKCSAQVLVGREYVLEATAAAGSRFVKWEGCPSPDGALCTIPSITRDRTVTAVFQPLP